jgi:hypothetical protein
VSDSKTRNVSLLEREVTRIETCMFEEGYVHFATGLHCRNIQVSAGVLLDGGGDWS